MLSKVIGKLMQLRQNNITVSKLQFFAATVFISLFVASTASVQAVSYYSDEWLVEASSNQDYSAGCGVLRTEYYEPYHLLSVSTTITSPDGRSSTAYGFDNGAEYKQPYVARADVSLALNLATAAIAGNFTTTSEHYSDCPIEYFGSTIQNRYFSLHAYKQKIGSVPTTYIPTCIGKCTENPLRNYDGFVNGFYLQCGSFVQPFTNDCLVPAVCEEIQVEGRCTN